MRGRGVRITGAALATVLLFAACGDDDDDETAGGGVTTTTEAEPDADSEAFCKDLIAIQSTEPDIPEGATEADEQKIQEQFFKDRFLPQARRIREAAPAEIKDELSEIVTLFEEKGPEAFDDDRFSQLNRTINEHAVDECGAEKVSVKAVDYAFQGVPGTIEAGPIGFFFENTGTELHEMVLLRKNDDTKESFQELVKLPRDEAEKKVTALGGAFAFPGKEDVRLVELKEGEYAMVCFIPVGSTPDKAESDQEPEGPPHVTRGMLQEFNVR